MNATPDRPRALAQAEKLHAAGYWVVPIQPGQKRPIGKDWGITRQGLDRRRTAARPAGGASLAFIAVPSCPAPAEYRRHRAFWQARRGRTGDRPPGLELESRLQPVRNARGWATPNSSRRSPALRKAIRRTVTGHIPGKSLRIRPEGNTPADFSIGPLGRPGGRRPTLSPCPRAPHGPEYRPARGILASASGAIAAVVTELLEHDLGDVAAGLSARPTAAAVAAAVAVAVAELVDRQADSNPPENGRVNPSIPEYLTSAYLTGVDLLDGRKGTGGHRRMITRPVGAYPPPCPARRRDRQGGRRPTLSPCPRARPRRSTAGTGHSGRRVGGDRRRDRRRPARRPSPPACPGARHHHHPQSAIRHPQSINSRISNVRLSNGR
jgi:hypothetical protein